ncbi:MAG: N-acetylmuramoyl-L-alanine amidase [Actinomycetota bacterium]|nr:N-acetylmuramoyl-L-alanine amidase [Actinomycetota bacterium]MEA2973420.1 N-acetylmuramoyl-L-alanine amidase [Actinomycetota bacterium]
MTHQPEPDPDSGADAIFPPLDIPPPANFPTKLLDGVPVGEVRDEKFDIPPKKAFQDALFNPESDADIKVDVVIEMGHVALRTGATGTAGEQDFNVAAAGHIASRLRQDGRTVVVIDCETFPPKSTVYVSIHCDGSESPSARGASVGFRDEKGARAAHAFLNAYQANGWSGGVRADNYTDALARYYGTRQAAEAGTPFAFITECGFLTNPDDRALLANETGHKRAAEAVRQAVNEVLGAPDDVLPALSAADQARLLETAKATNAEVGRLAVAIRDQTVGLTTTVSAARAQVAAIRSKLGA